LEITEEKRSDPQNKKFHAIIGQIAKQAQHAGAAWDVEDWKRFLLDQFSKDRGMAGGAVVQSLAGERVIQLGLQSRRFTKACPL
ncbi:recombination protein NinB, partial [Acinetobacter baumannii]|uniref:recombination protein NinB n=1 Tax=Acinetobacter baumannii TaxID=470 RepID=UPI00148DD389